MKHLEESLKKSIENRNTADTNESYKEDLLEFCSDILALEFRNNLASSSKIQINNEIKSSVEKISKKLIEHRDNVT